MSSRARVSASIAVTLLFSGAVACARRGDERPASAAPGSAAPSSPTPGSGAPAPETAPPATARGATAAPPLESAHAPFLSTLQGQGADHTHAPHEHAIPLTWQPPADWIAETPRNPMRRAQYRVAGQVGAGDAECAVFYFGPGQGGDAQGNVQRWVSMFSAPDGGEAPYRVTEQAVGDRKVTRIETRGTYHPMPMTMGGEPSPPQPGWMLLGAIVPGPDANWFFRCTGPERTLEAQGKGFDALIASVREAS